MPAKPVPNLFRRSVQRDSTHQPPPEQSPPEHSPAMPQKSSSRPPSSQEPLAEQPSSPAAAAEQAQPVAAMVEDTAVAAEPPPAPVPARVSALDSASGPWAEAQRRWHAHQRWAREAFRSLGADTSCGRGLTPQDLDTAACAAKLAECLVEGTAVDWTVAPLVTLLIKKAAVEDNHMLSYEEFEAFTWELRQMEKNVEVKADFVYKMFSGNKIGNLSRNEFMQLFKEPSGSSKGYLDNMMEQLDQDSEGGKNVAMVVAGEVEPQSSGKEGEDRNGEEEEKEEEEQEEDEGSMIADAPAWGAWAAPSEASSDTSSCSSREVSPHSPPRRSGLLRASQDLPPVGPEHHQSLQEAPAAWRELVRKKGLIHRDWATSRFASLDTDGDGFLTRSNLSGAAFARVLLECLGDRLPDAEDVDVLIDAAMRGADVEGDGHLGREDFEAFTWRLKRMVADTDFEVVQALGAAKGGAWRDLAARARVPHCEWAATAFVALDTDNDGLLARADLRKPGFEYLLRQCPGGRLADIAAVRPCEGLAFRRADAKGAGRLAKADFEEFTWQLARMGADVATEGARLSELVTQQKDDEAGG